MAETKEKAYFWAYLYELPFHTHNRIRAAAYDGGLSFNDYRAPVRTY